MLRKFIVCFLWVGFLSLGALPEAFAAGDATSSPFAHMSGEDVLAMLKKHNEVFQKRAHNFADVSPKRLQETAKGQHPYAVIVTCSDSRTPPEHIFTAGIGELFVIRNAGNIIDTNELGSIEYAVKYLQVKLIVVMGHTHCGAVDAALTYGSKVKPETALQEIVHNVHNNLQGEKDARKAEIRNVQSSVQKIYNIAEIQKYIKDGSVLLRGAVYDIQSGAVEFIDF